MPAGQEPLVQNGPSLRRSKFAARLPSWLPRHIVKVLGPDHARSVGNVLSLAQDLTSVYCTTCRVDGWTHACFRGWLSDSLRGRVHDPRSLRRYERWLLLCGIVQFERRNGHKRGKVLRVRMPHVLKLNGTPEHWAERADARREQDRLRQRRYRARKQGRPLVDDRPTLGGVPILDGARLAQEVDEIELEWADTPAKTQDAPVSRIHLTRPAPAAGQALPPALPAVQKEKQIPQTPSFAGGCQDRAAHNVGNGATTVAELGQRLCGVVAGGQLARDGLKSQWPEVYDDLRRAHPGGLGPYGLGGESAEEVRRVCQQVARRHARPELAAAPSLRKRCARLRSRVDRQAEAATTEQLLAAMVDALGPAAAATVRAHSLAQVGLPLAVAEVVLERICRHAKIGSAGPTALRSAAAVPAYVYTAFRRERLR